MAQLFCLDKSPQKSGSSAEKVAAITIPIVVGVMLIATVVAYFFRKFYMDKQGKKELLRFDNTLSTLFRNKAFQGDSEGSKSPPNPEVASTKSVDAQSLKTQMQMRRNTPVHLMAPESVTTTLPRPPSHPSMGGVSRPPSRPPSRQNGFY